MLKIKINHFPIGDVNIYLSTLNNTLFNMNTVHIKSFYGFYFQHVSLSLEKSSGKQAAAVSGLKWMEKDPDR